MKRGGRGQESSSSSEASGPTVYRGRGRAKIRIAEISGSETVGVRRTAAAQHERIGELICRPDYGEIGQPINLRANYKLMALPSKAIQIYLYDVKVLRHNGDPIENRDICREVFWAIVSNNEEIFGPGYSLVYDDCHTVFSMIRLKHERPTIQLQLWEEARGGFQPSRAAYLVLITPTSRSFTVTVDEQSPDFRISMQLLDCLVTQRVRCPPMNMAKSFYPFQQCLYLKPYEGIPWEIISMGPGMEAWNGLYGAVKRCERGLMLNVDVCTKVFYKIDIWLMDFYMALLNEFAGRRDKIVLEREGEKLSLSADQRKRLKDALQGLMLKLTYDNRHVKFIDVGLPARTQRFVLKRGEENVGEVTVEEYFRRYKGIALRFPNCPVLQCGRRTKPEYFPMELLRLSDKAQRVKKRLTPFQISKLIRGTALSPLERFKRIDWFLVNMAMTTEDEFLQQFGITFPSVSENYFPESVRVPGRILPSPTVQFKTQEMLVKDGYWRLEDNFFRAPSDMVIAIVCVDGAVDARNIRVPLNALLNTCTFFGMQFTPGFGMKDVRIYDWDTRNNDVKDHVLEFKKICNRLARDEINQLLIFVVPQKNDEIYGRIKVLCDKEEGIACQVIRAETFLKMGGNSRHNPVAHNICMKINAKLGGINNEVAKNQNFWKKLTDKAAPTLFLGIDVTHPPSGDTSNPSIAAVVGSLNANATRYAASIKILQPRKEKVEYVVDAFRTRIKEFDEQAGCKPQHIVLFRDGVSDTEFLDIMNEELLCLKAAAHQLALCEPTISYVVIQKRHHTRFVAEDEGMSRGRGNIPPGTVVDRTVTSASRFDFYLCSHLGAIGMSKPSHYTVLYDSWHLTADEWQQMAFALCHVFARCNKSVSLPAPVYYAHLACDRARYIMKYGRTAAAGEPSVYALEQIFELNPNTPSMYFV